MSRVPAILSISFRPFFILVALIAILNPIAWVLSYQGYFHIQLANVSALFWHGHEMIFGFSGAMIAGFILTASANWTSSEPYKGFSLLFLVMIWLAERLSYFFPLSQSVLLVVSNLFFPALTTMLLIKLFKFPKQKYVFIPILLIITIGKILNSWGYIFDNESVEILGREISIGVLRLIILLIAGRVLPFFTSKKIGLKIVVPPILNLLSIGSVALLILPWEIIIGGWFLSILFAVAIISNISRQCLWRPEKSVKIPILFILHIGVLFINLSLILELISLYYPEIKFSQAPLHMLMASGLGTVGIGIMSRVSLGHTGRVIVADRWIQVAYVFIVLGGLLRVFVPVLVPQLYLSSLVVSASFWSGGFMIFLLRFWFILVTPRPDGR